MLVGTFPKWMKSIARISKIERDRTERNRKERTGVSSSLSSLAADEIDSGLESVLDVNGLSDHVLMNQRR